MTMALPNMVVTGNLKEILGNVVSSELVESALSRARITFTPNVPNDAFVKWSGSLYRITPVQAIVNNDGDIVLGDGEESPVRLLAQDDGLNIRGLQWQVRIDIPSNVLPIAPSGRMRSFWFNAVGDGETVNLTSVLPQTETPLDGVTTLIPAMVDDITDAGTAGKAVVRAASQAAARNAISAVGRGDLMFNPIDYGAIGNGSTNDTVAVQTAYDAAVSAGGGVVVLPRGYRFKITDGIDLISSKVSLHSLGGWLSVGQIRVGDPTGVNDFAGVELRNILYDGENAYGTDAKALVLKGNARGLKVIGGAFKNTGKCVSADNADGATGFHKLGKIAFDGTQFSLCNYNIYVNTTAWDVCSDWRLSGILGGDTTRITNVYISGVDGIQIDTCVFFMADSASGYAYLTDKQYNVWIGETSQLHVHGNQFFVAGKSGLRVDKSWTMSITGNGFIWPGQIAQGDCIELRGANAAGNLVGTISGNTFNNWTRNAIGIFADTACDATKLNIADNAYSQNLAMTTNLTGVTLTTSNCHRVYIDTAVTGFPRVTDLPPEIPVYDWWKTSDRPQGRNLRGTFYGGESSCVRRAATINSGTGVGIFLLSGGDGGNVYSGLVIVTAHSSAISTAKEASYLLHVSRDGTRNPVVALISALGLTTGAAADEPSFTWTLGTDNLLTATRVGSTSGTNWWFRADCYGTVVAR